MLNSREIARLLLFIEVYSQNTQDVQNQTPQKQTFVCAKHLIVRDDSYRANNRRCRAKVPYRDIALLYDIADRRCLEPSGSWCRRRRGAGRADPKEDGVYKVASKFGARGLTRGELGLLLKQGPLRSELRIGRVASLNRHIHVGFGDVSSAPRDLLSMPVCKPDPDETRILKAMAAGATPRDLRKGFPRSVPRAARAAWVSSSSCWSTSCTSAGAS